MPLLDQQDSPALPTARICSVASPTTQFCITCLLSMHTAGYLGMLMVSNKAI